MARGAIRRRAALALAVVSASGALVLAGPGGVEAASPCTAGHKARVVSFSTGAVHVYKRGRYVCAITVAKQPGALQKMSVSIRARGGRPNGERRRVPKADGPQDRARGPALRVGRGVGWAGPGELGLDPLLSRVLC